MTPSQDITLEFVLFRYIMYLGHSIPLQGHYKIRAIGHAVSTAPLRVLIASAIKKIYVPSHHKQNQSSLLRVHAANTAQAQCMLSIQNS